MENEKIKSGFTLMELLVAITIVVTLSAIGIVSYRSANQKGRDGKRKSDINQVRAALEMYRSDEGLYPIGSDWTAMLSTLGSGYINNVPLDPRFSSDGWVYYYSSSDGYTYVVCARLESETGSCLGNPSCGGGTTCNYQFSNP
ncbi:type II secretion system GspH family protein [Patescibacteria group bacterium]|nr:type II secretion system GspH family protein [Patescibacteria group bacterium]